jgi:hypothetical protein
VRLIIRTFEERFGVKSLKEFLFPGKERVERGDRQGFAESPRPRKEIGLPAVDEIHEIFRFIDVKITFISDGIERLNAYRQFWQILHVIYLSNLPFFPAFSSAVRSPLRFLHIYLRLPLTKTSVILYS